jgi:hypothetical protein
VGQSSRSPNPSQGDLSYDDSYGVTATSGTALARPLRGQLDVRLDVPNLGQAVGFYSAFFDVAPLVAERRAVWFDVPDSPLRIELREALTPIGTQLRLCTDPRAISFHDPGRNRWELYASIAIPAPPRPSHRSAGRAWRSLTHGIGAAIRAASAMESRFD